MSDVEIKNGKDYSSDDDNSLKNEKEDSTFRKDGEPQYKPRKVIIIIIYLLWSLILVSIKTQKRKRTFLLHI